MFLIAVAPIQENYHNVNKIWQKLNLNNLLKNNATISTDLKLANLLCGIGTHASKFPCTWCTAENNQLHSKGAMRSISNIKANYTSYSAAGSNPKKPKILIVALTCLFSMKLLIKESWTYCLP